MHPPVYGIPCPPADSPLRRFIALPDPVLLVLGPRRVPPLPTPASNTYTGLSILTSIGFRTLEIDDYITAAQRLRPDILIGPADIQAGDALVKANTRRKEKMAERTMAWMKGLHANLQAADIGGAHEKRSALFAPVLPIDGEMQAEYLDYLSEILPGSVGGLALYRADNTLDVPKTLSNLPRLALTNPTNPHSLLREVALGIDIFTVPFLTTATDAGVALTFTFPPPPPSIDSNVPLQLGYSLHPSIHATSLLPLAPSCDCHTCTNHHRAYICHLLSAKEMLAWVLLQVHNHANIDRFFAGVRASIAAGRFEKDASAFERTYQTDLDLGTGQGPRVRGYQVRSEGATKEKRNKAPYQKLRGNGIEKESTSRDKGIGEDGNLSSRVEEVEMGDLGFAFLTQQEGQDEEGQDSN